MRFIAITLTKTTHTRAFISDTTHDGATSTQLSSLLINAVLANPYISSPHNIKNLYFSSINSSPHLSQNHGKLVSNFNLFMHLEN